MNTFFMILSFVSGFIVAIMLEIILTKNKELLYGRNCLNCKYSEPQKSQGGKIRIYCSRCTKSSYPVTNTDYCGHFDYTDELKTEHVKLQAEKMVKK